MRLNGSRKIVRGEISLPIILLAAAIVVLGPSLCSNPGSNTTTDGVFESAARKIDSGRADELTAAEIQRLHDTLNWCDACKKPLRLCKHGKQQQ